MVSDQKSALDAATTSAQGMAEHCEHLDGLTHVTMQEGHCQDCTAQEDHLVTLLICRTCGRVGCSDDSPHQHAKAHFDATAHPIVSPVAPGPPWRWCYVHQRLV